MLAILQTILAGLLATAAMSGALYAIHWRGFANADMIRAVGSLVTRREEGALAPGAIIHFASGVVFAFVYLVIWSTLPLATLQHYLALGLVTGLAHGLVVSFLLVILVAEHHPVPRFQAAGMAVAVAHLAAHVVYGIIVGLVAGSYHVQLDLLPEIG